MHRIDGPGAGVGLNNWTEGNPGLGIPATTVTDDYMNDSQEEICTIIEAEGLVLAKGTQDQLQDAISLMIASGGAAAADIDIPLLDNTGPADVTGLSFNKTNFKGGNFALDIHRRDDGQSKNETGMGYVSHNTETDTWGISLQSFDEDAATVFSITAGGQVQYTSSNFGGANYSGTLRVNNIKKIKQ